jgi:hypothetical protein
MNKAETARRGKDTRVLYPALELGRRVFRNRREVGGLAGLAPT